LLDVGAATGDFGARALAEGWDVVACELGDSARAKAAAKGLTTVASLDEAEGPFGLITMFHVLEHLISPLEVLEQARSLIDRDGLLAMEMPQWRSAGRLARRSRWAQLRPPEHINFFTKASLAAALHRSGWDVVSSSTPYPRAASLALQAARGRDLRRAANQAARLVVGASGFGGYLRAVARPA
jgi:2-polyprenyl-3-methyl-5-hydroxy-6-metoxy-1,4-benzoquinol methylase